MPAPWQETPTKVVVEFQKTNQGASRAIRIAHSGAVVPQQLAGRMNPVAWQAFIADVHAAAATHPYVVRPGASRVGGWLGAAACGAVLGCCIINPDGGDYGTWLPQVQVLVDRHAPAFAAAGAALSLQRAQQSHWLQADVNPAMMAVGRPAEDKPSYEPCKA